MTTTDIDALVREMRQARMVREAADDLERQQANYTALKKHEQIWRANAEKFEDLCDRQQAMVEAAREKFKRIIRVRAGDGMFEGREALDEMARLAGEALAALDAPPEGEGT